MAIRPISTVAFWTRYFALRFLDEKCQPPLVGPVLAKVDSSWESRLPMQFLEEPDGNKVRRHRVRVGVRPQPAAPAESPQLRLAQAKAVFTDPRVRKAISLAVDRVRLGQQMWGEGFYVFDGPVAAGIPRWALPYDELIKEPGYRWKQAEREEDIAEAKRLWAAGGGESLEPTDERVVVYAGVPDYIVQVWPQFQKMIRDTLGYELNGHVDSSGYTELDQCSLAKSCIFGFNYDNAWIDLDDWTYPYYHTTGSKNPFNLSDPTLDEMLEAQRAEFDFERRQQLGYEISTTCWTRSTPCCAGYRIPGPTPCGTTGGTTGLRPGLATASCWSTSGWTTVTPTSRGDPPSSRLA